MAEVDFGTADPQTRKVWSDLTMFEALRRTRFWDLVGTDETAIIQRVTDLESEQGDEIKFDLLAQLSGYGVNKNATLETNESALTYYQDSVKVEQKRMGVAWFRMSRQRSLHDLRAHASRALSMQASRIMDEYMAAFLVGTALGNAALDTDITAHAANSLTAPDANHLINGHAAVTFEPDFITEMRWSAEHGVSTPIRPVFSDETGQEHFVCFLHPWQAAELQAHADWKSAHQYGDVRGLKNALFSGSLGMWDGVVLKVWHHLPYDASGGAEIAPAILLGQQAGVVAFGNAYDRLDQAKYGKDHTFSWVEDDSDYMNRKGISLGGVFGVERVIFNSEANAVIRLNTRSVTPVGP